MEACIVSGVVQHHRRVSLAHQVISVASREWLRNS